MKLTFDVQGLDQATRDLAQQFSARRLSAVAATAATRTANEIRTEIQAEMSRVFDRPTPYTLRSVRVKAATASSPVAEVFISQQKALRDPSPAVVLQPQVDGGARGVKGLELVLRRLGVLPAGWLVVPSKALPLDAYGNISRGIVQQVLAQLRRLQSDAGPRDFRGLRKAARKAGAKFIAIKPGGKVEPGVYAADIAGGNLTPVFIFVRGARYRQRLDFYGIARRVAAAKLPEYLRKAFSESADRLAQRGR
jgi:hypothetical protein